jgi:hypothetical protein
MRHAQAAIEQIGEPRVEQHLNQDRHCEQPHHERLAHDRLPLKR